MEMVGVAMSKQEAMAVATMVEEEKERMKGER